MRIWLQEPAPEKLAPLYFKDLRARVKSLARPDAKVEVQDCDVGIPLNLRSQYFRHLYKEEMIDRILKAEKQGYDAAGIACLLDIGLQEAREVCNIPVAGMFESSILVACMLGKTFSIIPTSEKIGVYWKDLVRAYGFEDRATSFPIMKGIKDNIVDFGKAFEDPGLARTVISNFKAAAQEAAQKGAEVILPGCGLLSILLLKNNVLEVEGAVVLDEVGALLKMAESLGDLAAKAHMRTSRKCTYLQPPQEVFEQVRKKYRPPKAYP